jgi:hypothetical protein
MARRNASGSTTEFFYRARGAGHDRTVKLANHPDKSIDDAFELASVEAGKPITSKVGGTFGDLLNGYVAALKAAGKVSAADVERTLRRAIDRSNSLRRRRASVITPGDITAIIARRVRAGAKIEPNRLRAHLSAAFNFGAHADHDPARTAEGGPRFGITINPVAPVKRLEERHAGDNASAGEAYVPRVLTWPELGAYWRALGAESPAIRAALRFSLATGGQRLQMLLRAEWADVEKRHPDLGVPTIRLIDIKGRAGRARGRKHVLPLTPLATEQLKLVEGAARPFEVTHFTLSDAISRASAAVCKELRCDPFDARAIRRTVETRLSELGVPLEDRAFLLSHGRAPGVQADYDYAQRLPQKLDALTKLAAELRKAIAPRRPSRQGTPGARITRYTRGHSRARAAT